MRRKQCEINRMIWNKEIFQKDTFSILKDVTQKYVDMFGINDLSEEDRETIKTVIGNKV